MKIEVDKEKCIACGMCVYDPSANGAFDFVDGKAEVVKQEINDDIKNIVSVCPTGAISIN